MQVLIKAILGAGVHVHTDDIFTRVYIQPKHHAHDGHPLALPRRQPFRRCGALPLLLSLRRNARSRRDIERSSTPSQLLGQQRLPVLWILRLRMQGNLNEDNADDLLGEHTGHVPHSQTDAGGVSEIQRLCRDHAVRGNYWAGLPRGSLHNSPGRGH